VKNLTEHLLFAKTVPAIGDKRGARQVTAFTVVHDLVREIHHILMKR
jgi:hypothetical protein